MTQEMQNKFEMLAQDEAFIEKFLSSETPEAAKAVLAEQGIELSLEEVTALGQAIAATPPDGELSEDQLNNVAGGSVAGVLGGFVVFVNACKGAVWLGDKIGKGVGCVYKWFKNW